MMEEAYKRYMNNWDKELPRIGPCTQEEFINKIKTDDVFAKKWGVIVEVRELSLEERMDLYNKSNWNKDIFPSDVSGWNRLLDTYNIPTRAISLTFGNQTEVIYE
jgi:hypothetical protein